MMHGFPNCGTSTTTGNTTAVFFWNAALVKESKCEQGRQCTYNVTLRCVRIIIFAVGKQKVLYIVCVRIHALVIRKAMRMCRIISSPVACLAVQNFSHYVKNDLIFGKKLLNIQCVF